MGGLHLGPGHPFGTSAAIQTGELENPFGRLVATPYCGV